MFDLLIEGGKVLDGSGSPGIRADVGVRGGRIAEIGPLRGRSAVRRLDAEGQVVCPGFIDMHSHDDFNLPVNPLVPGKLLQGVTTQVTGNCGFSPAPTLPATRALFAGAAGFLDSGFSYSWRTLGEFMDALPELGCNVAQLLGHVSLRCAVMGMENRPPTDPELQGMKELVAEAMASGAFGLSTGLYYPPSCYAEADEITALMAVAGQWNGSYHTHMRDPRLGVFESTAEALEIGRRSGAAVQVSHLKLASRVHWGQAERLLGLLDDALAKGLRVACDQYPYLAGGGSLHSGLPQWSMTAGVPGMLAHLRDGDSRAKIRAEILDGVARGASTIPAWDKVILSDSASHPEWVGLDLASIAGQTGREPVDACLDLVLEDAGRTRKISIIMAEQDLRVIMRHPVTAIGSDGFIHTVPGQPETGQPHPRYYGTFPRVLGHYAREQQVLSLPEAVRKMTALPAGMLGLRERGLIREGFHADIVVFDPDTVADQATYQSPRLAPQGIFMVMVNGVVVAEQGSITGQTPGRVLRRNRQ